MNKGKSAPVRIFVRKIQFAALLTGILAGVALKIWWSHSVGIGFISGVIASVINFQLMAVDAFQMSGDDPRGTRKFIIGRYLIRYVMLFVFFAYIATRTEYDVVAAFIGFFIVQIVLIFGRLIGITSLSLMMFRG